MPASAAVGAFEATSKAHVRKAFDINAFGVVTMIQAVIQQFRQRHAGVIVNVTSSRTLAPMSLAVACTASKTAIEGFTGSLAHELYAFNVKAKLVEPGCAGPSASRRAQPNVWPPSTNSVWPVIQPLIGEARNRMTRLMSSGAPKRPKGKPVWVFW